VPLGFLTRNVRYKLLALTTSLVLWGVAHGTADIERGYDIPVVFTNLSDKLVIVDQNSDVVNVRMRGSRAGLRRMALEGFEYPVDATGARAGGANFEVDLGQIEFPRGVTPVSRSPSNLLVTFERRASRVVRVKPDLSGEPAEGFVVAGVDLDPTEVRITGAAGEVRRRGEVTTESIDVSGLDETEVRDVKVSINRPNVWLAEDKTIRATIRVKPAAESGRTR
jgi:YbbR domain-containing protein